MFTGQGECHLSLRKFASLACAVVLCAPLLRAESKTFVVAPDQSTVAFTLGGMVHSVHGTFSVKSGKIVFDSDNSEISGSIVVAAGSGKSGDTKRDRRMTKDVLEAGKFTGVSFAPQSLNGEIASSGKSTVQITGVFTVHGSPHELTVPVKIDIEGNKCRAETSFLVPYVRWGMKDASTLMIKVGKEVEVNLILVGQISTGS